MNNLGPVRTLNPLGHVTHIDYERERSDYVSATGGTRLCRPPNRLASPLVRPAICMIIVTTAVLFGATKEVYSEVNDSDMGEIVANSGEITAIAASGDLVVVGLGARICAFSRQFPEPRRLSCTGRLSAMVLGIELAEDAAYAVAANELYTIDMSSPAQSLSIRERTFLPGEATSLAVERDKVLVGVHSVGVMVFSQIRGGAAKIDSIVPLPCRVMDIDTSRNGIAIVGTVPRHLNAGELCGVTMLRLDSDGADVLSVMILPFGAELVTIELDGRVAIMSGGKVHVFLFNKDQAILEVKSTIGDDLSPLYATDLEVYGDALYIAWSDNRTSGVFVLDLTSLSNPKWVSVLRGRNVRSVYVNGDGLFSLDTTIGVRAYSIKDSLNPTIIGDMPRGIVVLRMVPIASRGELKIVAAMDGEAIVRLMTIDEDARSVRNIAIIDPGDVVLDIDAAGDMLAISVAGRGFGRILLYRIDSDLSVHEVGLISLDGYADEIRFYSNDAIVSIETFPGATNMAWYSFDIPASPVEVARIGLPLSVTSMAVGTGAVYVGTERSNAVPAMVVLFDVSHITTDGFIGVQSEIIPEEDCVQDSSSTKILVRAGQLWATTCAGRVFVFDTGAEDGRMALRRAFYLPQGRAEEIVPVEGGVMVLGGGSGGYHSRAGGRGILSVIDVDHSLTSNNGEWQVLSTWSPSLPLAAVQLNMQSVLVGSESGLAFYERLSKDSPYSDYHSMPFALSCNGCLYLPQISIARGGVPRKSDLTLGK